MFHNITTAVINQPKAHMLPIIDTLKDACKKIDDIDSLLLLDEYTQTTTLDLTLLKRVLICNNTNKIKKFIDRYKTTHLRIIVNVCYNNNHCDVLQMLLTDPDISEDALLDVLYQGENTDIDIMLHKKNNKPSKNYINHILIENCKLNRIKLVKYLHDHKADIMVNNREALKVSIHENNKNIIRYLIDLYKCDIDKELLNIGLRNSAIDDDIDMTKYYLNHGADMNVLLSEELQPWIANCEKIQKFLYNKKTAYDVLCEENEELKKEIEKLKKKNEAIIKIVNE